MTEGFAEHIDGLSTQRTLARNSGNSELAKKLTRLIDECYAARRRAAAEDVHGTREEIVKRARIETELERLMADPR